VKLTEARLKTADQWLAAIRLAAVGFAVFQVVIATPFPADRTWWVWTTTGVFAIGAVTFFILFRRPRSDRSARSLGIAALAFDLLVIASFITCFTYDRGTPTRQLLYLAILEAAVRFGMAAALVVVAVSAVPLAVFELVRSRRFHTGFGYDDLTFQIGVQLIVALIVGWLVQRLAGEARIAEQRADEALELRDRLGRRVDLLEASSRCARALGSSLELDAAFGAFIRELRGLVPFDRAAIVLVDGTQSRVMATAGVGAAGPYGPGSLFVGTPQVIAPLDRGETVYRRNMPAAPYTEEAWLLELGLSSRVVVPLMSGANRIGVLSLARTEPDAFDPEEVELATLLGRVVATAIQNIRAYDAERSTVEELRRLSALRADFVSLVSHELRSPMAAVIGAARTLQERWRELQPDQRASFLALIGDETTRLAELIGDVLDTSRIEAGTFSYSFAPVDIGELLRDTVSTAAVAQDEVRLDVDAEDRLPRVRGDRERLRQVFVNLIDNAVKFSPAGEAVCVRAQAQNGNVRVSVVDHGPGILAEHRRLIFEKFGRAKAGGGKPGTGLGLFIARSIVEAHGGSLDVGVTPGGGATFTVDLPL
jgi:signal transduction histidine kinase